MPQESAKPTPDADYSKEAYVAEKITSKVMFENDGTYTAESTIRFRIQSQAGVKAAGLLAIPYASAVTTLDLLYVRVIKPDQRIVQTPIENVLDMPSQITQAAPFYSDLKEKHVAVKGLEVGDTLEYAYRAHIYTALDPGQFWYSYDFFKGGICLDEELQIGVPKDHYVNVKSATVQPTVADEGAYRIYRWKAANLERKTADKKSDSTKDEPPSVELTTFRNWDEVGQWIRTLVDPRAEPTPDVQAKARELTKDDKSDADRIKTIYNYVSLKFRYIGIALGIGRYQPHAAEDVLTNDYGDCKDKHTLLAALLAAVGVKAYPALINSSGKKIDSDVPSPRQFDHMITVVAQDHGMLWLDTTTEIAPQGYLVDSLRDKQALVIFDKEPARLIETPPDPPFESLLDFQSAGKLDANGTFEGNIQLTTRGDTELALRSAFRITPQEKWSDVMQQISYGLAFAGTVSDVTSSNPEATDTPFHIEYHYVRKEYGEWENRQITPPLPPVSLPEAPTEESEKAKPIKLGSPIEIILRAKLEMPPGSTPRTPTGQDLKENFAEYHSTYSISNGVLQAERRLVTKQHEVAPNEIEKFRAFRKAIADEESRFMPLRGESEESLVTAGSIEAGKLYDKGRSEWQAQDIPAAAESFREALDKDPQSADAWLALGMSHVAMGRPVDGVEEMKRAIEINPGMIAAYQTLGPLLMRMKRYDEALEVWRKLEKLDPDNNITVTNIAGLLIQQKRYSEAIPELENARKRDGNDSRLAVELGQAYLSSGQKDKAGAMFEEVVAADSSVDTLNNVAYVMADGNLELDRASEWAQRATAKAESDSDDMEIDELDKEDLKNMVQLSMYWDTLGWVYFRQGHFETAEKYISAAWNLGQQPIVGDHLGQVYEKEGKTQAAAHTYALAIAAGQIGRQTLEGTHERLNKLQNQARAETDVQAAKGELSKLRGVDLPKPTTEEATAEFFVLFGPDAKVLGVAFVGGSESLRKADKALAMAKFNILFPTDHPAKILRRGILVCEPVLPTCQFVMYMPQDVHSLQ